MSMTPGHPECIRYNTKNNSVLFAVTDDNGEVVAVHEVFLNKKAKEIGRKTTGAPELGYVRFRGTGSATIHVGEPEDGMKLWTETGQEVWVDVSKVPDTIHG